MALNESFENIKNMAADAAQTAARKAKELTVIAKANLAIRAEQDKQRKAYTELGKLYYRDYVTEEEPDEAEYMPLCDKISASLQAVAAQKEIIEAAKAANPDCAEEEVVEADFVEAEEPAEEASAAEEDSTEE